MIPASLLVSQISKRERYNRNLKMSRKNQTSGPNNDDSKFSIK